MPIYRFDDFRLDATERRLSHGDARVDVTGRYLDALLLLVREHGRLVTKDRFMGEVWRGVPVTDEALTQCIRTLRRCLGDAAAAPRFIETVPRHGYRFVAEVTVADEAPAAPGPTGAVQRAICGTLGGGVAGLAGGALYGFAAAMQPARDVGAASVLLVLIAVSALVALAGAAGVAAGVVAGQRRGRAAMGSIAGGAAGGLLVGGGAKLLGLDAFALLLGRAPGDVTGAMEGAILGAAVGWSAWRARPALLRTSLLLAGAAGSIAGGLISLLGGRLMAGSLDLLSRSFPDGRLSLAQLGILTGEPGFGAGARVLANVLDGALFVVCVVAGLLLADRKPAA